MLWSGIRRLTLTLPDGRQSGLRPALLLVRLPPLDGGAKPVAQHVHCVGNAHTPTHHRMQRNKFSFKFSFCDHHQPTPPTGSTNPSESPFQYLKQGCDQWPMACLESPALRAALRASCWRRGSPGCWASRRSRPSCTGTRQQRGAARGSPRLTQCANNNRLLRRPLCNRTMQNSSFCIHQLLDYY